MICKLNKSRPEIARTCTELRWIFQKHCSLIRSASVLLLCLLQIMQRGYVNGSNLIAFLDMYILFSVPFDLRYRDFYLRKYLHLLCFLLKYLLRNSTCSEGTYLVHSILNPLGLTDFVLILGGLCLKDDSRTEGAQSDSFTQITKGIFFCSIIATALRSVWVVDDHFLN